jgi:tetratricopeptide (TPR) repeat protein
MVGTPAYMAPEQFTGEDVGPATDQFSLAVTLYFALWRTRPFAGSTVTEIATAVREGQLAPPPDTGPVPPAIRAAILRALSTAPGDRFPSMRAFVDAIQPPRRARWPIAGAGVLAIGAAVAIGALATSEGERCAGFERELSGIWDPPRKATLERAFAGAPAWAIVAPALDGYAADWTRAKVAACRARQAGGESAQLVDRRLACLDTRLRDLETAVTSLAAARDHAVEVAVSLPRLQQCENLSVVGATAAPIGADRATVRTIEAGLAKLGPLRWSSRFAEGRAEADRVIAAARSIDWVSAEARALVGRGWLEYHAGEFTRAKESHLAAASRATAAGDTFAHAQALIGLVGVDGAALDAPADALRWADLADAAVRQAGNDPELAGLLAHGRGTALWKLGRHEEAVETLRWAWLVLDRALGNKHPFVAMARFSLTNPLRDLGRLEEARTELETLLAMELEVFGQAYPSLGHTQNNLGLTYVGLGRDADAESMFVRALATYERLGKQHPFTAWPLHNLVGLAQRRGDFDAADRYWQRAYDTRVASVGESSGEVTQLLLERLVDRTNRGLDDEARTLAQRVLGRFEARPSPQQGFAIGVVCELERRDSPAKATQTCDKALALLGDDPTRYDVHATAAIIATMSGDLSRARLQLAEAERAVADIRSERAFADAIVDRARAYVLRMSGRPADAEAAARRAIAVLAGDGRYRYYADELARIWK